MSERDILHALSVDNVRAHVEHICEHIPSRLAGSENQRRMAEYSLKSLRESGVEACIFNIPGLVSFPEKAEFKVLAPVEMTIEANTLGHSTQTPPEGISGELLDVYTGAFDEYRGKNPVGAISMSELSYQPARHEKQRIAGLLGARGCVMMNWGGPDNAVVPFGSVKPCWGNPTPDNYESEMPTLPCIGIARTEGLRVWRAWRSSLMHGRVPEEGIVSALLVLVGSVLLIAPGVLSDIAGILLLFPPTRRPIAAMVRRRIERKLREGSLRVFTMRQGPLRDEGPVIEVKPERKED